MTPFVSLPSASSMLASVASSSSPLFDQLIPIAYVSVGFAVGGMIVYFLIHAIINGVGKVTAGRWGSHDMS